MKYDLIQTSDRDTVPAFDPTTFWTEFRHGTVTVNGVRLHFVEGGNGEPVLLLPGWPQSWYAWRYVMPLLLAAGRQVIALDPRGMGDSDRPASGYDLQTVTSDVHGFVGALGLTSKGPVDVVGHDVGTWIGYAYAAEWPVDVKRLAVFDAAVPGVTPPPAAGIPSPEANLKTWHFGFNRLDDLPELLLQGRADKGVGTGLVETMRLVATNVRGGVFEGCGHYIPEEAPRSLADQIIKFMGV